jgi:hypothetical protein
VPLAPLCFVGENSAPRTGEKGMTTNKELIVEALTETLMTLEAPPGSPRTWPVSKGNLHAMVERALQAAKTISESGWIGSGGSRHE